MATKEEHVDKADRNATFAKSLKLDNQTNLEWAFVSFFYSGIHYVDAYCEQMGIAPHLHGTHAKREKLIVLDSKLRRMYREYMELKNFSMRARYFCHPMNVSDFEAIALPAHKAIKAEIQAML